MSHIMLTSFLVESTRRVAALAIGGLILWQVADKAGPQCGEVVVHIAEPGVEVYVDGSLLAYQADVLQPIQETMRSGRHTLTMKRGKTTLYEETFTLEGGGVAILSARDLSKYTEQPGKPPAFVVEENRRGQLNRGPIPRPNERHNPRLARKSG